MPITRSQPYKNRARGVLSSRQDDHQVAKFVSVPFPDKLEKRKRKMPTQHSQLCFQNCNWLFARDRDPLETNRTIQSTNNELENTWCWKAAWNSHIEVYYEICKLHRNFFDGQLMIRDQWAIRRPRSPLRKTWRSGFQVLASYEV